MLGVLSKDSYCCSEVYLPGQGVAAKSTIENVVMLHQPTVLEYFICTTFSDVKMYQVLNALNEPKEMSADHNLPMCQTLCSPVLKDYSSTNQTRSQAGFFILVGVSL